MCLHGLDILSMWMLFFSLLCATASAFQHSHLAKDLEVFVTNCMNNPRSCSAGVDEMRVLQLFVFFVPTMFSGILGSFVENSTVLSSLFGLHANIVEEYVLLSALLHDQSCLQSSPCFQHQFVWLPFSRTLVCKGGLFVLFMYMGARESCLRACATLLCHARVKTIGTSLCLTSSSLIVSATITERS